MGSASTAGTSMRWCLVLCAGEIWTAVEGYRSMLRLAKEKVRPAHHGHALPPLLPEVGHTLGGAGPTPPPSDTSRSSQSECRYTSQHCYHSTYWVQVQRASIVTVSQALHGVQAVKGGDEGYTGGFCCKGGCALWVLVPGWRCGSLGRGWTYWVTFNEPTVFCLLTYCVGVWPPGFVAHPCTSPSASPPLGSLARPWETSQGAPRGLARPSARSECTPWHAVYRTVQYCTVACHCCPALWLRRVRQGCGPVTCWCTVH